MIDKDNKNIDTEYTDDEMNKAIAEILENMGSRFQREKLLRHEEKIHEVLNQFDHLPSISQATRLQRENDEPYSTVVDALVSRELGDKKHWVINSVLRNVVNIESFVKYQISQREGSACSRDKSLSIVQLYINNELRIAKGEQSLFESGYDFDKWNLPKLGSAPLWFDLIFSLLYFHSGQVEKFNKAMKNLDDFYQD